MYYNNTLVIGIGPHAKRIYIPLLQSYQKTLGVNLVGVIDLVSKQGEIEKYLTDLGIHCKAYFFEKNDFQIKNGQFILKEATKHKLNAIVESLNIQSVIISTEPLTHTMYAEWCLESGLHILMDKPVSTRKDIVTNYKYAQGIQDDYFGLKKLYLEKYPEGNLIFSCLSQRRYHGAYNQICKDIETVGLASGIPVTSIYIQHSDGQWRMPNEILHEIYHGYNEGYGKCSHSGSVVSNS